MPKKDNDICVQPLIPGQVKARANELDNIVARLNKILLLLLKYCLMDWVKKSLITFYFQDAAVWS